MPEALAVCPKPSESLALQCLTLALTPRLGATRARRLVEHFGGVQNIFKASLTELEATGRGAPNTLIKQGAKLTATWEDVWEELPTAVRLALTPATRDESQTCKTASLFGESELPSH